MNLKSKFICFFPVVLFAVFCSAQETKPILLRQTLSDIGTSTTLQHNGRTYTIHQSIGQSSIGGTLESVNLTVRQGFLQPETKAITSIPEQVLEVLAYPNPFRTLIAIQLNPIPDGPWRMDLFDMQGRVVFQEKFILKQTPWVDLQHIISGVYVARVTAGAMTKSFRIVKL